MSEIKPDFRTETWSNIRRPWLAFKDISDDDLTKGIIIILLVAVFNAIAQHLYFSKLPLQVFFPQASTLPMDSVGIRRNLAMINIIGTFTWSITGWVLVSLIIHGVSTVISTSGSLKRVFTMIGFCSIPLLIQQVFRVLDAFFVDPEKLILFVNLDNSALGLTKLYISTNLFTIFGIYYLALLVYAIKENYSTSTPTSVIVAILPHIFLPMIRQII